MTCTNVRRVGQRCANLECVPCRERAPVPPPGVDENTFRVHDPNEQVLIPASLDEYAKWEHDANGYLREAVGAPLAVTPNASVTRDDACDPTGQENARAIAKADTHCVACGARYVWRYGHTCPPAPTPSKESFICQCGCGGVDRCRADAAMSTPSSCPTPVTPLADQVARNFCEEHAHEADLTFQRRLAEWFAGAYEAERERCAKLCDDEAESWNHSSEYGKRGARDCAARIRKSAPVSRKDSGGAIHAHERPRPMTIMQTAEELSNALMVRARLIERARKALRGDDLQGAIVDILNCLEHVQDHEQRFLRLHAECHGLIEYAGKVLADELARRPVPIVVGAGPSGCKADR